MELDLSVLDAILPSSEPKACDTTQYIRSSTQSGATLHTTPCTRSSTQSDTIQCTQSSTQLGTSSYAETDAVNKITASTLSSTTSSAINYTRIEREREAKAQQAEMYRAYQSAIVKSETLRCELLEGIHANENPHDLLLKAVEVIGLITGDKGYYRQATTKINTHRGK